MSRPATPRSALGRAFRLATIALTLVAAGGLTGMAYFAEALPFGRAYTDGVEIVPAHSDLNARVVVHEPPEPFLEELWRGRSLGSRLAVHPAGDVVVYAAAGSRERSDLYWARLVDGRWSPQGPVVELNRPESDEVGPSFAADGTLFFASNRSEGEGYDLYLARFDGVRFRDLVRLGRGINSEHDELDPAFDARTNQLFFASNRPRQAWRVEGEDFDLYRARADAREPSGFAPAERLDALSSRANDRAPVLHPRGGRIVFSSERPGGRGGYDLYEATVSLAERSFLEPVPFALANSALDERDPTFLDGGFRLVFRRADPRAQATEVGADDAPDRPLAAAEPGVFQCRSRELERLPGKLTAVDLLTIAALLLLIALMAFLANRWQALDLLYKAFLISLLVHVLLLLLSRRVEIVREIEDVPPPTPISTTFELAFAAQPDPTLAMWGGELPPRDRAVREERAIDRATAEPRPVDEPTPREIEPLPSVERAEPVRRVPERTPEVPERRAAEEPSFAVAVAEPDAPAPDARETPRFAVEEGTAIARERPVVAARSERGSAAAPAEREPTTTPRPVTALAVPERVERSSTPAERRNDVAPERTAPSLPESIALREPSPVPPTASPEDSAAEANRERVLLGSAEEVPRATRPQASTAGRPGMAHLPVEGLPVAGGAAAGRPVAVDRPASTPAVPQRSERSIERASAPAADLPSAVALREPAADLPTAARTPEGTSAPSPTDLLAGLDAGPRAVRRVSPGAEPPSRAVSPRPVPDGAVGPAEPSRPPAAPTIARGGASTSASPGRRPPVDLPTASGAPDPSTALADPSLPVAIAERASSAENEPAPDLLVDLAPRSFPTRGPRAARGPDAATSGGRSAVAGPSLPALEKPTDRPRPVEIARADDPRRGTTGRPSRAVVPERFSRRQDVTLREEALREGGGSRETERAVAAGLRYLAERQRSSGYWGDPRQPHEKYGYTLFGKTGLALLAFLGAGHTPRSGTTYSDVVARGIQFLLRSQNDGGHFGNCSSYGHAIATYALCEAYAMERDDAWKRPLQTAVDWIVFRQKRDAPGSREYGGWGYYYPDDRVFDPYARASITAWQVMALESARLGGLDVAPAALDAARSFLKMAFDARTGTFRYSHDPARLRSIYPTLPGSTPAALFVLRLQGEDLEGPLYQGAWRFLAERRPVDFQRHSDLDFVKQGAGNLYFWYYGTLALFQRGGNDWELWNTALKRVLLPAQDENGSWRPISPYAETAGDTNEDRVYTTAMCVLMLEVYYRYFTPLLDRR